MGETTQKLTIKLKSRTTDVVMWRLRETSGLLRVPSTAHRILSLILTAAAGLTLDALPPQSLDSRRELRWELQTGRVAWRCRKTAQGERSASATHTAFWLQLTDSSDPLVSFKNEGVEEEEGEEGAFGLSNLAVRKILQTNMTVCHRCSFAGLEEWQTKTTSSAAESQELSATPASSPGQVCYTSRASAWIQRKGLISY